MCETESSVVQPTTQPIEKQLTPQEKQEAQQELITSQLFGQCTESTKGYWTYKFCVGDEGEIMQFHTNDRYMLGKYHHINGDQLFYANGQSCEPVAKTYRETSIHFMCSPNAPTLHIHDIDEYETCKYKMIVTSSLLCTKDSLFETLDSSTSTPSKQNVADRADAYILELNPLTIRDSQTNIFQPSISCRLRFVDFHLKSHPTKSCFKEVEFQIESSSNLSKEPIIDAVLLDSDDNPLQFENRFNSKYSDGKLIVQSVGELNSRVESIVVSVVDT